MSSLNQKFEISDTTEHTRTFKVVPEKIQGMVDDLQALKQAIEKQLCTNRYNYDIYSFDYGVDFDGLLGEDEIYVKIEVKRRIKEALMSDDRITGVDNFTFVCEGDCMKIDFDVSSIYGKLHFRREVEV